MRKPDLAVHRGRLALLAPPFLVFLVAPFIPAGFAAPVCLTGRRCAGFLNQSFRGRSAPPASIARRRKLFEISFCGSIVLTADRFGGCSRSQQKRCAKNSLASKAWGRKPWTRYFYTPAGNRSSLPTLTRGASSRVTNSYRPRPTTPQRRNFCTDICPRTPASSTNLTRCLWRLASASASALPRTVPPVHWNHGCRDGQSLARLPVT